MAFSGNSPIMSFSQGNIISLLSASSGRHLSIDSGEVTGMGGVDAKAQFIVHVRRSCVVALQNLEDQSRWLAIWNSRLIGTGQGGPFCEFLVGEIDERHVVLESCSSPGQRVGVLPSGYPKPPNETGTGQHARFTPIVQYYAFPPAPPTAPPVAPHMAPPIAPHMAPPIAPQMVPPIAPQMTPPITSPAFTQAAPVPTPDYPLAVGYSPLLLLFTQGNVVILRSKASGKDLRITNDGDVDGRGGGFKLAQFMVHVRRPGVVGLQNVANLPNWLCIKNGLTSAGNGDHFCEFNVRELGNNEICLESTISPGQHIGILPTGEAKAPGKTGTGQHGRFTVSVYYQNPSPPRVNMQSMPDLSPPPYYPPTNVSTTPGLRAAQSGLLAVFEEGAKIRLRSLASNRNLRIQDGVVKGTGADGPYATFVVHVRGPSVVALQTGSNWLRILKSGELDGRGGGGKWTEFMLRQINDESISLESVVIPGQYVGVLPNGDVRVITGMDPGVQGLFYPYKA